MSDDDDAEEMRRMRASATFKRVDGGRAEVRSELATLRREVDAQSRNSPPPPPPPMRRKDDDDEDDAPQWKPVAPKIAFKSAVGCAAPPPPPVVDDEAAALQSMGFASFGAKKTAAPTLAQKNAEFKRVDAPQRVVVSTSFAAASSSSAPTLAHDRTARADDSDDDFGPAIPPSVTSSSSSSSSSSSASGPKATAAPIDMQRAFHNPFNLPISHEATFLGHARSVTAMALDPSGTRLLTGSLDYEVKFWDFAGMDATFRSFRQITPHDGYPVEQISYSVTGDSFLVATGEHCAKLYDRDGHALGEYMKGDKYIMDLKNTKGHCAALSDVKFHPRDRQTFITSSLDGSVRIWDVENFKSQTTVIKVKPLKKRCQVTCCAYAPDATFILAGTNEGTLQLFDTRGKYMWADKQTQAHSTESLVTALLMASNGQTVVSRALDDSLRVWDLRKFKEPVRVFADLPCLCPQSDMAFSPDEQVIVTGTSLTERVALDSAAATASAASAAVHGEPERRKVKTHELHSRGQLVFIDRTNLDIVQHLAVAQSTVNRVLWHPKLNQIFTSSGDAKIHALYDPELSVKGVLISAGKARRKKAADDFLEQVANIAPEVAPTYREKTKGAIWREERNQSKPEVPTKSGPGKRAASSHASFHDFLTSHMLRQTVHEQDPQAAVLKYADAAKNPMFFRSYVETQPEALKQFDEEYLEEEAAKAEAIKKLHEVDEDDAPVYKKFKSAAALAPQ